jgi:pyrimidine-nucleoside phosphorylase
MVDSGESLDLSAVVPYAVDKHSTGGVGDKTTLVVQPIVAACGVPVGKMSGRGLSYTGGTLDKMESIPGFRVDLSMEEFLEQLRSEGLVLSGQTADLAPADGKLYALRDVTGTVPSIPLIASSVMSKKIAGGAQGVVLDVKVGVGAFMQDLAEAEELAELMVSIGRIAGRDVVAVISDMNQPLGVAVGNALEVKEAIATLQGEGPEDFREHCLVIASHMLALAGRAADATEGHSIAGEALNSGAARRKFAALIRAQDGDDSVIDHPDRLPQAESIQEVQVEIPGYLARVHAREIGLAAMELGAGRARKGDPVDHAVGVEIHNNVGDRVVRGDPLFTVHANSPAALDQAIVRLTAAHSIQAAPVEALPLFYKTISSRA